MSLPTVKQLVSWCSSNHLLLNMQKTIEMAVNLRHNHPSLLPLSIWLSGYHDGLTQVPGHKQNQGPDMGEEHDLHSQENTAENGISETAEETQPITKPDDPVLHRDNQVHPHTTQNFLFLHLTRTCQTPKHSQNRLKDQWM